MNYIENYNLALSDNRARRREAEDTVRYRPDDIISMSLINGANGAAIRTSRPRAHLE